jgi:hypothetical protein
MQKQLQEEQNRTTLRYKCIQHPLTIYPMPKPRQLHAQPNPSNKDKKRDNLPPHPPQHPPSPPSSPSHHHPPVSPDPTQSYQQPRQTASSHYPSSLRSPRRTPSPPCESPAPPLPRRTPLSAYRPCRAWCPRGTVSPRQMTRRCCSLPRRTSGPSSGSWRGWICRTRGSRRARRGKSSLRACGSALGRPGGGVSCELCLVRCLVKGVQASLRCRRG